MNKFNIAPAHPKNNFFNIFDDVFGKDMQAFVGRDQKNTIPAVNISESDTEFEIELAVPGYKKADFNIDIEEQTLRLSATMEKSEVTKKYNRKEFNYSSFERSFTLPDTADGENVKATYTNGVLFVTVPKREEEAKKAFKIKVK